MGVACGLWWCCDCEEVEVEVEDSGAMLCRWEVKVDMSTLRRRGAVAEGLMLCSTGGEGWLVMRWWEEMKRGGGEETEAYLRIGSPF